MLTGGFCADADDALRFFSAVDRIADWLGALGDTDAKPIRRAKALGYLANPNQVLDLMDQATGSGGDDGDANRQGAPFPEATLHVHFTRDQWHADRAGAASLEGVGPITLTQARDILGHAHVRIHPVIDLDHMPSSDDRFVRGRMREAMVVKNPHCIFPYCNRDCHRSEGEHNIAWPRGQTTIDNLAPVHGKHHRAKTHAGWDLVQALNGIYLWKSPHGRLYLVDHRGATHDLGLPSASRQPPPQPG